MLQDQAALVRAKDGDCVVFDLDGTLADTSADLFDLTQAMTAVAGLPAYEVSNHARPGAESRHNRAYWRYDDYVGVGPGAHGRLDLYGRRYATVCERLPERWREKVEKQGHGFAVVEEITSEAGAHENLLMSLRLENLLMVTMTTLLMTLLN